jgi:hypothetical protein
MAAALDEPVPAFIAGSPRAVQILSPPLQKKNRFSQQGYDDASFQKVLHDPSAFPEFKNFVHNNDGDIPQLNALTGTKLQEKGLPTIEDMVKHKKAFKHCLMKIAAGCSNTESPNDASYCHMETKRMANASSVVQTELFSDRDQEAMIAKFVKEVFKDGVGKNIPSARKTTMEQYLKNSLRVFSKAFNKDNVQDGFRAVSSFCALHANAKHK